MRGGAGSGKTVARLTQAKELTRGVHGMPGQRVALLCYSVGLASWFKRYMSTVDRRHRPDFIGTFEDLAAYLGVTEFGGRDDPDFWENRLPQQMAELVGDLPDSKKFDSVVVDEAQDFADVWWTPIMHCLRDEERGGIYVYSDENQRVFARFGRPPVPLVPLVLDSNLRNTRQIAEAFGPLAPMRMYARGGEGPEVTFVPCALEEALDVATTRSTRCSTRLAARGHRTAHHWRRATRSRWRFRSRWGRTATGTPSGTTTMSSTGTCSASRASSAGSSCWRPTSRAQDRSRERLYVGLSRATDKLVVVGPPDLVQEIGGPEVAKRLGIA